MSNYTKKSKKDLIKIEKKCSELGCPVPNNCKKGEILRKAYVRKSYVKKDGTKVKESIVIPSCIKNQGAPGKGKDLIKLNPADHYLSSHGYHQVKELSVEKRHKSLEKTQKDLSILHGDKNSYLYVIRALNARANLTHRTDPIGSKIFREDGRWMSKKYAKWKLRK